MWSMIRWLVLRFAALRWLMKLFGLGLFIPIAFLLKIIGLPLLAILSVIGLPILAILFLFGLPVILVFVFGSMLMGLVGVLLSIGFVALKFFIFIVLPIWLFATVAGKLWSWMFKRGDDNCGGSPPASSKPDTPPPSTGPVSDAASAPPGAEPA